MSHPGGSSRGGGFGFGGLFSSPAGGTGGQIVSQSSRGGGGGFGGAAFNRFMKEQSKLSQSRNQQMMEMLRTSQNRARQGFAQARGQLEGSATSSIQRLREQGERSLGSAEQDLISRGLGNTTVRTNVRRGIEADVGRGETDIQSMLAQQMANLSGQEAQFEMQAGSQGLQGFGMQSGGMQQMMQIIQMMMQGGGF